MRQYEVLMAKKLFHGSDIVRRFSYKITAGRDNYALLLTTDCFVCCSPYDAAHSPAAS